MKGTVREQDDAAVDVAAAWKSLEYAQVASDVCRATGGDDRLCCYIRKCESVDTDTDTNTVLQSTFNIAL